MRGNYVQTIGALATTLAFGMMGTAALADLPDDRIVTYNVREDPYDEDSPIIFTVDLEITAHDADGDTVRWFVKRAVLTEIDNSENPPLTVTWAEDEPYVDTLDGYWAIEHEDLENVTAEDFDEVPYIAGKAYPDDPRDPEMDYDLEGEELAGSGPFASVFSIVHLYGILSQQQEPQIDIDDTPVEVLSDFTDEGSS